MAYISKAQVIRASKLVESINLDSGKEYNPTKVFVDSKDLEDSKDEPRMKPTSDTKVVNPGSGQQIKTSEDDDKALYKLYTLYIRSKSI